MICFNCRFVDPILPSAPLDRRFSPLRRQNQMASASEQPLQIGSARHLVFFRFAERAWSILRPPAISSDRNTAGITQGSGRHPGATDRIATDRLRAPGTGRALPAPRTSPRGPLGAWAGRCRATPGPPGSGQRQF